jgi:osmotically-inducible protein OsmY
MTTALGCVSTASLQRAGAEVKDGAITAEVKAAIFNEPTLQSEQIHVDTFEGVVYLSGFVSSSAAEDTAIAVARSVSGVKSVKHSTRLK